MKRIAFAAACAAALGAGPAHAQFDFLTEVFEEVNSVTIAVQGSHLPGSRGVRSRDGECMGVGLCGMTAEVLIDLPSVGGQDLELGLGTSFLRGFESTEPSLDLHGSLRSFPTLTAYLSLPEEWGMGIAEPYAGASFGLAMLWNARGYDADGLEYEVEAETIEYGVSAGLYLIKPSGLFIEGAYRWRQFESLDWEFPDAAGSTLPAGWPRDLDLSGWVFSLGWQFRLRPGKGDEKPAATPPPPPPAPASPTGR